MAGLYIGVRFLAIMGKKHKKTSLCRHNSRFLIDFIHVWQEKSYFLSITQCHIGNHCQRASSNISLKSLSLSN